VNYGRGLRRAREIAGLTLDEVAERSEVPTEYLRLAEDGRFDGPASIHAMKSMVVAPFAGKWSARTSGS